MLSGYNVILPIWGGSLRAGSAGGLFVVSGGRVTMARCEHLLVCRWEDPMWGSMAT